MALIAWTCRIALTALLAQAPKNYDIVLQGNGPGHVGDTTKVTCNIRPKAPYVIKTATPFSARLRPSAGLQVDKETFGNKDFVDAHPGEIAFNATAKAAGAQRIDVDVTFFLCSEQLCERTKDTATYRTEVN